MSLCSNSLWLVPLWRESEGAGGGGGGGTGLPLRLEAAVGGCTAAGVMSYPRFSIATVGVIGVVVLCTSPGKHLVSSTGSLSEAHRTKEAAPRADFLAYAGVVCFWLLTMR